MLEFLSKVFKFIERWEYYRPANFWFCTLIGYLCFTSLFNEPPSSINSPSQIEVVTQEFRGGSQPKGGKPWWKVFWKGKPFTITPKSDIPKTPKPEISKSSGLPSGTIGNPVNEKNRDMDDDIGTKKWENWVCPKTEQIISNPEFWSDLAKNPEICKNEDLEEDIEEDECEDIERQEEVPRRRLMQVPTLTSKLDAENLQKFDFTNRKLKPMTFPSREGIKLSMDHRSLRKAVYSHSQELGLTDLGNRIQCPVQVDSSKFQRADCWAITDVNIREAVIKVFEFTTFNNPKIITLERFPSNCSTQRATYFVDIVSGNVVYF